MKKKKETLSASEIAIMQDVKNEWLKRFFSGKTVLNKDLCSKQIEWLYKLAGYKRPFIIYVDSPMACQYAVHYLKNVFSGDVELFEHNGTIFAAVGGDGARLQHVHESNFTDKCWTSTEEIAKADHASHMLPPGNYEFYIQNAYNPYTKLMEQVID